MESGRQEEQELEAKSWVGGSYRFGTWQFPLSAHDKNVECA